MASEKRTREILKGLHDAVVAFDEDKTVELCHAALNEGIDPYTAVMDGLAGGMVEVGDLYNKKVYFVPQLLLCSDALYAGLDIMKPAILASGRETPVKGSIVIGVVEGDIHDIGKNLVKAMFEAAGWTVYDLGRDVKLERFVEEQARTDAEIVGLSALTTTSMLAMGVKHIMCHICGEQNLNLPYWAQVPMGDPGIVSFGHEVDLEVASKYFPNDIIMGNVEPAVIQDGTPEQVYELTKICIEKGRKHSGGFMLAPGCEMPPRAPSYNVWTVMKAVSDYGWYE